MPVPNSKPTSDATPVEAANVAVVEASVPTPKRVVPVVAKPRPKPLAETVNDHLDAAKALVEKVAQTRPEADSGLDPWERPEVEPWMSPRDRQWMADFEAVEPLNRYPKILNEKGAITDEVQRWLSDRWGAAGRRYSFHTFFREGRGLRDTDRRIGFASWRMAMEFKLAWRT